MPQSIPANRLLDSRTLDDPYDFYRQLREQAPVWQIPGRDVFLVTGYGLLEEATRRVEDFSSHMNQLLYRDEQGIPACVPIGDHGIHVLATADPPEHTRHKNAVFPGFVGQRMAGMGAEIEAVAIDCVESALAKGTADFMAEIGNRVPITIVSRLVGFPEDDTDRLLQAAFDSTSIVGVTLSLDEIVALSDRNREIFAWVTEQFGTAKPGDATIMGSLAQAVQEERLTAIEASAILATLLAAGGESTASLMGNAVRMLSENGTLQAQLRARLELVPAFLEEVLRLESPFRFHLRSVPAATRLGDVGIPAGSAVLLFWAAGNRDAAQFANPDVLDMSRPRRHMAFGRGVHLCVGAPLARLEAQTVLRVLLERTAGIGPVAGDPPRWVESLQVRRHERLPVTLIPR